MKTKPGSLAIWLSALLLIGSSCLPVPLQAAQLAAARDSDEQMSDSESRVDVIIELTPQRIALLKQYGAVRVTVPRHLDGRIDSILFQQSGSELDSPETTPVEAQLVGNSIVGDIDSSLLDYVAHRPVRMMVYHSGYQSVLIRLDQGSQLFPDQFAENSLPTDSPLVWVKLKDGRKVAGKLRDQAGIRYKSQFYDGNIPFDTFAGVHLGSAKNSVLWLKNGDQVKGELFLDEFKLLTRWGERTFQRSDVKSITSDRDTIDPFESANSELKAPAASAKTSSSETKAK